MEKTKPVFKRNNGGEIRGVEMQQPPRSEPFEEAPSIILPLKGAGDAVKTPYADAIGSKTAINQYQDGDKVEGTGDPAVAEPGSDAGVQPGVVPDVVKVDMGLEPSAAYKQQQEKLATMYAHNQVWDKEFEERSLKNKLGDTWDQETFNRVSQLSDEDRLDFIPRDVEVAPADYPLYTSNTAIYNQINREKKSVADYAALGHTYDSEKFQLLVSKAGAQKRYESMGEAANVVQNMSIKQLENKLSTFGYLSDEDQEKLQDLKDNPVHTEEMSVAYEHMRDIDRKLGIEGEYDSSKFSASTQIDDSVQGVTGGINDFLTDAIPLLGPMIGEGVVSIGDLVRPKGSTAEFLEAIGSEQEGALAEAAQELGIDLVNAAGLVTLFGGGAPMKVAARYLTTPQAAKTFLKASINKVKSSWKTYKELPGLQKMFLPEKALGLSTGQALSLRGVESAAGVGLAMDFLGQEGDLMDEGLRRWISHSATDKWGIIDPRFLNRYGRQVYDPTFNPESLEDFLKAKDITFDDAVAHYSTTGAFDEDINISIDAIREAQARPDREAAAIAKYESEDE